MKLLDFLNSDEGRAERRATWARRFGISETHLSQLASGRKRPGLDLAFRIERATGGKVKAASFVRPPPPAKEVEDGKGLQRAR